MFKRGRAWIAALVLVLAMGLLPAFAIAEEGDEDGSAFGETVNATNVKIETGETSVSTQVSLTEGSDGDYYAFTAPETGEYYLLYSASDDEIDPKVTIYDEDGDEVASDDDSGKDNDFRLVCQLEGGSTYYVLVQEYDGHAANLTMTIEQLAAPTELTVAVQEDAKLVIGDSTQGDWYDPDEEEDSDGVKYFDFYTSAVKSILTVTADGAEVPASDYDVAYDCSDWEADKSYDVTVSYVGEKRTAKVNVISFSEAVENAVQLTTEQGATVGEGGTWYSFTPAEGGYYRFSVAYDGDEDGVSLDLYESDGSRIAVEWRSVTQRLEPGSTYYLWAYAYVKGATLSVKQSTAPKSLTATLADGAQLGYGLNWYGRWDTYDDDEDNEVTYFRFSSSAVSDALVVEAQYDDGTTEKLSSSDYDVDYDSTQVTGPGQNLSVTVSYLDVSSDSIEIPVVSVTSLSAGNLSLGSTTVSGDTWYAFTAPASATYTFASSVNTNSDPAAELYDADGNKVASGQDVGEDVNFSFTADLKAGATYMLHAFDSFSDNEYTLSITIPIAAATVSVANATYTGKAITPAVTVKLGTTTLRQGTDYTVAYGNNTNAGKASVTVTGAGAYSGTATANFTIAKAANTLTAKGKTATVKAKNVKKKAQTVKAAKAFKVANAQGKVTYKLSSAKKGSKSYKSKFKVSSSGKITAKKGLKKGTYTLKVNVTAAGNGNYNAATKTVTVKVKVK